MDVPVVSLSDQEREALLKSLRAACNDKDGAVATDDESLQDCSKDASFHQPCRPLAVVMPSTPQEVAAVVRACTSAKVPMVPRGAGSGLEGGAIPYGGGVVVSTERLRRMELLQDEMLAIVGAGIRKDELNKFIAPHGLVFGPDPSSNPTIGGMASTGGSGMTTLRYGTTKENVAALLVVTPQGDIVETRRPVRKSSSGYELTQLYMGSEGTLGIICELTVRVRKQPPLRSGGIMSFPTVKDAVLTVVATVKADPASLLRCELLNGEGVVCTNKIYNTSLRECPTLFLEMRGSDADALRRDFETIGSIATQHGCPPENVVYATNGDTLDEVWDARRGCYMASIKYRGVKGGDRVFISDVCVPRARLADCVAEAEADATRLGLKCVICAHIADGNFHCMIPHQLPERNIVKEFEHNLVNYAIESGGTVTGEHGVGIGKISHSCKEHGPAHVAVQQSLKRALDPLGLMNPGKVLPLPSTQAAAKL